MLKKLSIGVLSIIFLAGSIPSSAYPDGPMVEAPSALLIELRRGQVLYAKNPDEPLHIAAASKLMTALIAIEKTENNTMITASREAVDTEGALLELTVGKKYAAEGLIYACMLNNANDATIALAEAVGGTVDDFVILMNDYAASLNMSNTVFVNPTGHYDQKQRTTASDIALLIRHALASSPEFEQVFSSQAKPWFDEERTDVLTNLNDMFWSYDGVDGGKVDYDDPKFQTVITTATRVQQRLLCILLDAPAASMYAESMKILDYGFENFKRGPLVSKGQPMEDIMIEGHHVTLVAGSDVFYTYPVSYNYIQNVKYEPIESNQRLPLYKNTVLGNIKFTLTDGTIIAVDLFPDKEILPEMTVFEKARRRLMEFEEILYIAAGLGVLELVILLFKSFQWLKKRRKST